MLSVGNLDLNWPILLCGKTPESCYQLRRWLDALEFVDEFLQAVAGVAVQYLGYTPGIFIVGLFAILILWMYANFWITGILFVVGGKACIYTC